jgi:hypothetical protein
MGSKRGDRSQHPWRPVNRGVHGYKGVATDAEADPPIVPVPVSVGVVDAEPDYLATLGGTPLLLGAGGSPGGGFTVLGPHEVAFDTTPDASGEGFRRYYFDEIPDQWVMYDVMVFAKTAWSGPDADSVELFGGWYNDTDDTFDFVKKYGGGYPGTSLQTEARTPQDFWWEQQMSHTFGALGTPPN